MVWLRRRVWPVRSEGKGSKLWMIVAGAGAVVGAALIYHLATSSSEGSEEENE